MNALEMIVPCGLQLEPVTWSGLRAVAEEFGRTGELESPLRLAGAA
jgi:hypothetical protein